MGLRPLSEEERQKIRIARRRQKLSETQKLYMRDVQYETGIFDRAQLDAMQEQQDQARADRYQRAQKGRERIEMILVKPMLTPEEHKAKMKRMLADCRKSRTIFRGSYYKKGNKLITLIGRTLSNEDHDIWWWILIGMLGVVVLMILATAVFMVTFILELNS